jgi:hypothetical protein
MSNEDMFDGLAEGMRELIEGAPEDANGCFMAVEDQSGDLVLFARGKSAQSIRGKVMKKGEWTGVPFRKQAEA